MSASLKVTVLVEKDGVVVRRLVRRLSVLDTVEAGYTKATGGGYITLPLGELAELREVLRDIAPGARRHKAFPLDPVRSIRDMRPRVFQPLTV